MQRGLLFLCFTLFASGVFAQEKLFKIDYKLDVSEELLANSDTSDNFSLAMVAALAQAFADDDKPQIQAWVNRDFMRVETSGLGESIQITDRKNEKSYLLYPSMNMYTETTDATDKVSINDVGDNILITSAADFPIRLVADTSKTIAGIPCKLAVMDVDLGEYTAQLPGDAKIEIWYTETVPTLYWGEYAYLKNIPGAALSISTFGIGIQASQVMQIDFDASLFEVPEDYELQESGMTEIYDTSDIPLGHGLYTYQDEDTELMGIKDEGDNPITEAKFSYIYEFVGDYAVVADATGLFGIINPQAQEVIPCTWEHLTIDEETQQLIFSENNKMGVMDMQQKVLIPAKFDYLMPFIDGHAVFSEDLKNGLINLKGETVLPATYDNIVEYSPTWAIAIENDLYYLVNIQTKKKTEKGYSYLTFANEADFLVASENGKYGYITHDEKVVIPFKYHYAAPFYDGVAAVNETEDGETTYINAKGETVELPTAW